MARITLTNLIHQYREVQIGTVPQFVYDEYLTQFLNNPRDIYTFLKDIKFVKWDDYNCKLATPIFERFPDELKIKGCLSLCDIARIYEFDPVINNNQISYQYVDMIGLILSGISILEPSGQKFVYNTIMTSLLTKLITLVASSFQYPNLGTLTIPTNRPIENRSSYRYMVEDVQIAKWMVLAGYSSYIIMPNDVKMQVELEM